MSSPTTALASDTRVPTRRTSWKSYNNTYTPLTANLSEKQHMIPPPINTTSNPFLDSPSSATDIEAQTSDLPFPPKPKKSSKSRLCGQVLCSLVFIATCVVGILFLLNSGFPGAVGYDRIREMKNELVDTERAVEVLKTQMGAMTGYFRGLNFKGMGEGLFVGNGTMRGAVNASVEGWGEGGMVGDGIVDGMVDGVGL
ncbi:hypothetical protein HBH56_029570 [Parastagonospora nodorum]|uniref:Uncharacterized protein n=2 Tax=Phaeosphaeria nodorum (strain SN15 / ATCC MYA-4574 / FGSC 10173) TaxID=321614 RepID=A0A7U2I2A6_PHANO|nr:hypothetical protein SNOG_06543 [Parastagonospora nodorum SN15]KAH3919162.1 hypothetical protein HBH56_029570 [Parastagonospora nodorum]EAT86374.1 hypothetical protein SNOG_06543 [Parastagonospora nodorum SN15]KAH3934162.1 hypothetical protein HBH54_052450 [Parastagonospora nodorum]KAH3959323.1 hypothetical protein HBH51_200620 [Parastagonospora nodorum]KAH3984904.1 hypothetical protein HBH52_051280 [Parastagonospora nodorum]